VQAEVDAAVLVNNGDEKLSYDALQGSLIIIFYGNTRVVGLSVTKAVLKESLRLAAPVTIRQRTLMQDDVIGGYKLRAGLHVTFSPWTVMGRCCVSGDACVSIDSTITVGMA
jgi:cytochrome P450